MSSKEKGTGDLSAENKFRCTVDVEFGSEADTKLGFVRTYFPLSKGFAEPFPY
jgi:hypothetical protein